MLRRTTVKWPGMQGLTLHSFSSTLHSSIKRLKGHAGSLRWSINRSTSGNNAMPPQTNVRRYVTQRVDSPIRHNAMPPAAFTQGWFQAKPRWCWVTRGVDIHRVRAEA